MSTLVNVLMGCVAAGVITVVTIPRYLQRIKRKRHSKQVQILQDSQWIKVGTIKELYAYPVMYGEEKEISQCVFEENGIVIENEQGGIIRDKMFVVYDEESKCVQNHKNFTSLMKLKITALSKDTVYFKDQDDILHVNLQNDVMKGREAVECKVWNYLNETLYYIQCIDCGNEAAKWVSKILMNKDSGLRVGYYISKTSKIISLWENFNGLYESKDSLKKSIDFEAQISKDLPIYTMITEQSLEEVNKTLLRDKGVHDFGANFVISMQKPFLECQNEYFKIGNNVIIANTKPWKRPRVNPMAIPNELKLKLMSIYCKVIVPGKVQIDDDVYIRTNIDV